MAAVFTLLFILRAPCLAANPIALAAGVLIGGDALVAGERARAERHLDCPASAVQATISRCKLKASAVPFASSLGRPLDAVTLNIHFQGEIVNMSIEFSPATSVEAALAAIRTTLGMEHKVEYWADDDHLYASHIWVDGKAEVEVTEIVKGAAGDRKVRVYVSSLTGGRPLHPADAR